MEIVEPRVVRVFRDLSRPRPVELGEEVITLPEEVAHRTPIDRFAHGAPCRIVIKGGDAPVNGDARQPILRAPSKGDRLPAAFARADITVGVGPVGAPVEAGDPVAGRVGASEIPTIARRVVAERVLPVPGPAGVEGARVPVDRRGPPGARGGAAAS